MRLLRYIVCLVAALLFWGRMTAQDTTYVVVTTSADVNNSLDGVLSLREALSSLQPGVTVVSFQFPQGMSDTIHLLGAGMPNTTACLLIDGTNLGPDGGHVVLDGGGTLPALIVNAGASLSLRNMDFVHCARPSGAGAAIYNLGILSLEQCRFLHNSARYGGAIGSDASAVNDPSASLYARHCAFVGNSATDQGGAIAFEGPHSLRLEGCAFDSNSAPSGGAVLFGFTAPGTTSRMASADIRGCSFFANSATAGDGGALLATRRDILLFVDNCSLLLNSAYASAADSSHSGRGGAIATTFVGDSPWLRYGTLLNSTLAFNYAETSGGAVYYTQCLGVGNCIVAQNRALQLAYQLYFPTSSYQGRSRLVSRYNLRGLSYNANDCVGDLDAALFPPFAVDSNDFYRPAFLFHSLRNGVPFHYLRPVSGHLAYCSGARTARYGLEGMVYGAVVDSLGDYLCFDTCDNGSSWVMDSTDMLGARRQGGGGDSCYVMGAIASQIGHLDTVVSACDSFVWRGRSFYADTLVADTLSTAQGDSIVSLLLTVRRHSYAMLTDAACGSLNWGGTIFVHDTVAVFHHLNSVGCDSTFTLNLTIRPVDTTRLCDTLLDSVTYDGVTFTADTLLQHRLTNALGCDSLVLHQLHFRYSPVYTDTSATTCGFFDWHGQHLVSSATAYDTLVGWRGNDSIVVLHLSLIPPDTSWMAVEACGSYTWPLNGVTYREPDSSASVRLTNRWGCDSMVFLHLTLHRSDTSLLTPVVCDSFFWQPMHRMFYASTDTMLRLTNRYGCDSVLRLRLAVSYSRSGFDQQNVCDSYHWPHNGVTYYASTDQPYVHLSTTQGCDSTLFLQLQVRYSTTTVYDDSICQGESYSFGGQNLTASGTYGCMFPNSVGCDSSVTLFLTVLTPPVLTIHYQYDCIQGVSILSTPNAMPFVQWSAQPDDPSLGNQLHNSEIVVTPAVLTEYTLFTDYAETYTCPASLSQQVSPVVVPEAKISFRPAVLTLDDRHLYALDVSHGNDHGRAWYVNGSYYTSHEVLWYTADNDVDSLEVMLVAMSATCNDTAWVVVPFHKVTLYVPNAFTPEQTSNNLLLVQGSGITEYEIAIYSRSGQLVYASQDISQGWDGTAQGKPQPEGSYVYIIQYSDVVSPRIPKVKKGQVLLLR